MKIQSTRIDHSGVLPVVEMIIADTPDPLQSTTSIVLRVDSVPNIGNVPLAVIQNSDKGSASIVLRNYLP